MNAETTTQAPSYYKELVCLTITRSQMIDLMCAVTDSAGKWGDMARETMNDAAGRATRYQIADDLHELHGIVGAALRSPAVS
jgi:hypothetical protein